MARNRSEKIPTDIALIQAFVKAAAAFERERGDRLTTTHARAMYGAWDVLPLRHQEAAVRGTAVPRGYFTSYAKNLAKLFGIEYAT